MMNPGNEFTCVVGVDVAKNKLDCAVGDQESVVSLKNSKQQIIEQLIQKIEDPQSTIVVMEATGGYEELLVSTLTRQTKVLIAKLDQSM